MKYIQKGITKEVAEAQLLKLKVLLAQLNDGTLFAKTYSGSEGFSIKLYDVLRSDYTVNDEGKLTSLGTSGDPLAICVIPSGFISSSPDARFMRIDMEKEISLPWGYNNGAYLDVSTLANILNVPCVGHGKSWMPTNEVEHTNTYGYMPSEIFNTVKNPYDFGTLWAYDDIDCHIPSPFLLEEGESSYKFNNGIYNYIDENSGEVKVTATADIAGWENSKKIITAAVNLDDSQCAAKYIDSTYNDNNESRWYLPAMGELGFIMPHIDALNKKIDKERGLSLRTDSHYWSSTLYDSGDAYVIRTDDGGVSHDEKDCINLVRPFFHISPANS